MSSTAAAIARRLAELPELTMTPYAGPELGREFALELRHERAPS